MDLFGRRKIKELELELTYQRTRGNNLEAANNHLGRQIVALRTSLGIGIGRILAKVDPVYATSELDPSRKAASDKIGEDVIKRLMSEHLEAQRFNGDKA